jgi:hypothetical protein
MAASAAAAASSKSRVGHKRKRIEETLADCKLGELWRDAPDEFTALLEARETLCAALPANVAKAVACQLLAPVPRIDWEALGEGKTWWSAEKVWSECAEMTSDERVDVWSCLLRFLLRCGLDTRSLLLTTLDLETNAAYAMVMEHENDPRACPLDLTRTTRNGGTALIEAVQSRTVDPEFVYRLARLMDTKTLNAKDNDGRTALVVAINWSSLTMRDSIVATLLLHAREDGSGIRLIGDESRVQVDRTTPHARVSFGAFDSRAVTLPEWTSALALHNSAIYLDVSGKLSEAYTRQLTFHRTCAFAACTPWLLPDLRTLVVDYVYLF